MVLRRRRSAIGGGGERERGVFVRLGFLYLVHFRCCVRLKKKVNANSKIVDLSFFFSFKKAFKLKYAIVCIKGNVKHLV